MPARKAARRPALLACEPGEGVRQVALDLLAEVGAAAARLSDPADAEALHDFRVAARRLRSWLRSFRPLVEDTLRRRWLRALKAVAGATGAARDAEVMQEWIRAARAGMPPPHRAAVETFAAGLAPGEGAAGPRAAAAAALARLAPRLEAGLSRYLREVRARPRARFGDAWAAALRAQEAALAAALADVGGPGDVAHAHRARIEGKRLRYLLEPLRPLVPAARAAVASMKALQDVLGELHDLHVLTARLAEARAGAPAGARPGLAALARRALAQRDALHADLQRGWSEEGARLRELRGRVRRAAGAAVRRRAHGGERRGR